MEYPEAVHGKTASTHAFLIHLYGHLNWRLGQLDYLRFTLSSEGAMTRAERPPHFFDRTRLQTSTSPSR